MFGWLKNSIQNVKIWIDFPSYNKQCKEEYLALAEFKFSTKKLEEDIQQKLKPILNEKKVLFDYKFDRLQRDTKSLESGNSNLRTMLSLFEHNYKSELSQKYDEKKSLYDEKNGLHERINKIREELKDAFEEKDEAYRRVNSAQDDVDSWHAKSQRSTFLFGNKGKKLPNHSIFGQSYGDLDGYKYDRDEAYSDAQGCRDEIDSLKSDQNSTWLRINEIKDRIHILKAEIINTKDDRQKMFEMKKKGINSNKLKNKININSNTIKEQTHMLDDIDTQRVDFLKVSKRQAGIDKKEDEIRKIHKEKIQFINEFNKEHSIGLRKTKHREEWLKKYGSVKTE